MPDILVPLGFFAMVTSIAIGFPLVRGLVRRWEREGTAPRVPSEVQARLERIEQAVDAIAVEVERMSEGQRFVTKLLAERGADRAAEPARLPDAASRHGGPGNAY
jgi:hypothetical protein